MSRRVRTDDNKADTAVEAELDRLTLIPILGLRAQYRELFRTDAPMAFGPDLLRRSIAQRIQEKAYGGLSRSTQRVLDQATKAYDAKPDARIVSPRRIKPGSELVRAWKGETYRVMVMADGFVYDGKTFGNLSEIAVLITGTRWNGPRFFGLRSKQQEAIEPARTDGSGCRKRSSVKSPTASRYFGGGSDYRKRNAEMAASKGNRHGR